MRLYSAGSIEVPDIAPTILYQKGPFKVTETMLSALLTTVVLILIAVILRVFFLPRWQKNHRKKSAFRLLIEAIVQLFDGTAKEQTGHNGGFVGSFYFSFAAFIFVGTLMEMTGLRPPTSDLSATLAMGLATFVLILVLGFKEKKARRLLHYVNPLNLFSDGVVPMSLALRMFGSVFSGYLIMHLIYSLPWQAVLPISLTGVMTAASLLFTVFHAVMQSYIFMFLSMCFIGEATE